MNKIAGIQQIGIGVSDVRTAQKWYKENLGYDIAIFDEAAEANLMLPYTDGKPQSRHAILAYNMRGGGGFEIWQYTSRIPTAPNFEIQLGDLGIFACKIKSADVKKAYEIFQAKNINIISELNKAPNGKLHFFIKDPYNNIFEIEDNTDSLLNLDKIAGGASGVIIGVKDIEKSKEFYSKILGYDTVIYEEEGVFEDLKGIAGSQNKYKRALLSHSQERVGAFSPLLGNSTIELIQVTDRTAEHIYKDRLWGDLGYIHLCYDVLDMSEIKTSCENLGHPFTVNSTNSFDMGEAAGHFTYVEAPEGTLIEFVETHKVPIMKKIGWYLNLQKRGQLKPLPKWFFKLLGFARKV